MSWSSSTTSTSIMLYRQLYREGRARAQHAFRADGPAVSLDDGARDEEAEAEPGIFVGGDRTFEPLEDMGQAIRRNADALIRDHQPGQVLAPFDGNGYGSARAELDGVPKQVGDHLLELGSIPGAD